MRAGYDRIVSELVGKGHTVVPPPGDEIPLDTAVDVINAALSKAEIAVHLLGEKAGEAPEDQLPMVKLQLALAAAKETQGGGAKFHRVIWAPSLWTVKPDPALPTREATRHPVDVLAKFDSQLPTDKIEGDSLSKFVDFLNQHLLAIAPPRSLAALPGPGSDVRLYLYHSQEDSDYALSLAQALQQRQLEALLPVFDGPDAEIKSFNGKQLAACDAVIFAGRRRRRSGFAPKRAACATGMISDERSSFTIAPWSRLRLPAIGRRRASCCSRAAKSIW